MNSTPSAAKIVGIGPERDRRAGDPTARRCVADDEHLALRDAALGVFLAIALAVAVDLDDQPLGQRVHDRDADAVEAARHLVAAAAELAAGVEHGEHDLGRALALVLPRRERIDRDAAAVVDDLAPAVGEQCDADPGAMAGHRLVDRVVDDLPDQVVQARQARGTDVHPGTFTDRVEPLEDLDRVGVVRRRGLALVRVGPPRARRGGDFGVRNCIGNLGGVAGHSYLVLSAGFVCGHPSVGCNSWATELRRNLVATGDHPTSGVSQSRGRARCRTRRWRLGISGRRARRRVRCRRGRRRTTG